MKAIAIGVILVCTAVFTSVLAGTGQTQVRFGGNPDPTSASIERGARWLVSVQGDDGGWGQDGGGTSYIRIDERIESNGNDVANTAIAALALLGAGPEYQRPVERAVVFVLERVEASPRNGLRITDIQGTQIQRKLGPYIDTFLAATLLGEVAGHLSPDLDPRVRRALEKVVAKIEQNQQADGSWNIEGGWAPVLGTSLASQSLFRAQAQGILVDLAVLDRADEYTRKAVEAASASGGAFAAPPEAAGVALYQGAQALEQLTRTEADRERNAAAIAAIQAQVADSGFVEGFGSMGGEEFFSYLNVSEGLKRTGADQWEEWHSDITRRILSLQNGDGSWAGHHCITGRVAVTSGAMLNLAVKAVGDAD
jgi:hypothetical protein